MSNIQSYNALIDRFHAFASGHFILKRFSHGQIEVSDLEKFGEYPFMHVVPSNVTYSKGMKTFSFQIVLADLPRDKEDKPEYQREVLSDLQRIAEDLVAEITNHRVLFGDLITVQNVSLEPFLEEFQHTLTGWTISLDLLVPYYWDACSIPAEWNDFFESGSGGTGSILTFIDSINRDNNGNVSLVNDEATPAPNYYYGTNGAGVRGWYLTTDNIGLTCETIGDCQTIIDIEAAIDALEEEILLKADITSISAVGFSNNYNDLDNLPTIPAAQVNSDWNATSGVEEILNKPTLTSGTVTSVALTMPSAFSVANSPVTTSGSLDVTGAGTVSQYVRGDGSLANFPSSTGGGSSLSYYLNGSVAQGTIGGIAFKEMDRTPVLGVGTDFTINANGYIQSFITDANVPNQLEIPAGNWNFETYFSASSNGGTPSFYIELYKWNGATLSLIASNSATPEGITNGTAIDVYFSALAVPQTSLLVTDRLAIRIYVTHSGRTITLHTEDNHLCQVITTFSTGLTALNGLTAQVQNFATGTTGTDFGISSATSTHTFNLPTASATNRGALSSADWTMFNSKVPSTRSLTINGTTQDLSADRTFTIATGLTIGTTPITSGTVGRVLFEGTGNVLQQSGSFFWDNTNSRLGIGTATPTGSVTIIGAYASDTAAPLVVQNTTPYGGPNYNQYVQLWLNSSGGIMGSIRNNGEFSFNNTISTAYFRSGTAGSASTPIYGNNGSNGIFFPTANTMAFTTNAVETLRMFSTNNIGIGTGTDAGYKLDVNGTTHIAQKLSVGTPTAASAITEITSTTKGFLPPRMTTTQKNAIASPATGLVVYDTTLNALNFYNGTSWSSGGGGGGVTQIVAGTNVTISPAGGTGAVTINSSGGSQVGYRGFKYNISVYSGLLPFPNATSGQAIILFYNDGESNEYNGISISQTDANGLNAAGLIFDYLNKQPFTLFTGATSYVTFNNTGTQFIGGAYRINGNSYAGVDASTLNGQVGYFDFGTSQFVPAFAGYSMAGNLNGAVIPVGTSYLGIGSSIPGSTISSRSFYAVTPNRIAQNCYITTAGVMTGSMSIRLIHNVTPMGAEFVLPSGTAAATYEFINFLSLSSTTSILSIRITQTGLASCGINNFSLNLS